MKIGKKEFDLENHCYVMGILNVTPDSFSDGGKWNRIDAAKKHTGEMIRDGAAIIDIGGESTRPGYQKISDEEEISRYLTALLHKEAFDHAGLIYGMGHAVYSLSDPRAQIFRGFVKRLSAEKGYEKEFALYTAVERLAPQIIAAERKIYKGVSPNVDFYSGFVYTMLDLPEELFTPMFAVARIAGWSAHRIEELINVNKIIRPAYKSIAENRAYTPIADR